MTLSDISVFVKQKKIFQFSLTFLIGIGLGYFLKDIILWRRKEEGYIYEIFKEIMNIKAEMKNIKTKLKKNDKNKKAYDFVEKSLPLDQDEFEDARSSLDEIESFYSLMDDSLLDLDGFISEINEILLVENVENYNKCYELCENELWKFRESGEFLWRYAMIAYYTTILQELDNEIRNQRINRAFNNALTAVKKSPQSSEAHKWLGILYGVTGLFGDTRKRILNGYKFKEHIDECISLNPYDAYAYLLKGRFCYQVSNLTFLEKKLAAWLFETPPVATLEEAFVCFKKCEELSPNKYGENHYFLSLCYQKFGDYTLSSKFLESAQNLPCFDPDIKQAISNS